MAAPQKTAFQASMEFAETHGIYDIDRELRIMAKTAGTTDGPLAEHVRALFVQKVQSYAAGLRLTPFLPPPPTISDGLFTLGTASGIPFRLTPVETLRHILVAGPSGAGKTSLLQPLALQIRHLGGHLIVADFKSDLQWLATRDDDFLIIHPGISLNILDHPDYIERSDYINLLITLLTRSYYGGEHLRQVAHETLWLAYRQYAHPSIEDWISVIRSRLSPKETYQRRDAYNGLIMRLTRFLEQFPGMARTRVGIPHATLWRHSLYLGRLHQNDTTELLTAWTVHNYHAWARAYQQRNTALLYGIFLDEGLLTFADGNRIDGPVLLPLVPLLREYGAALAIATAHLGAIHETIRTNAYTTIALPHTNATDATAVATTMGLNKEQTAFLLTMHTGQALVRTGKWRAPFLIDFPPLPYTKDVTQSEWHSAIERTNRLAPHQDCSPVVNTAPAPLHATDDTPPPAAKPTDDKPKPTRLNRAEIALVRHVCTVGVSTVSDAYDATQLAPQVGNRAATKLVGLGLLTREGMRVHGHRGNSAVGLRPTPLAYKRFPDIKPSHGTRGGDSAQHQWLVTHLAAQIPGAMIETTLGTKSIDLLFRITPDHDALQHVIDEYGQPLTTNPARIAHNDLVSIEVETTAATAANNVVKNLDAGIALNITAVTPEAVDAARRALTRDLTEEQQRRVIIINVFRLLEGLQQGGHQ